MSRFEFIKITLLLLAPFILTAVVFFVSKGVVAVRTISEEEKRVLNYLSELQRVPEIPEIPSLKLPGTIKDPFLIIKKKIQRAKDNIPAVIKKEKEIKWHLTLVVVGRKKKYAMLNNMLVREGSYINNYMVKEIGPDFVVLKKNDKTVRVFIKPEVTQ